MLKLQQKIITIFLIIFFLFNFYYISAQEISDPAPTTPGTPDSISPTNSNTPSWSWTESTDNNLSHYIFYWDKNSGGEANNSGNITNTEFTIPTALDDGTWYGKVKAFDNSSNQSEFSGNTSILIDTTPPSTPTASPNAGTYSTNQSVTLSSTDPETTYVDIFYTIDGSIPDSRSNLYTSSISINQSTTIKAIALNSFGDSSGILEANYEISAVTPTTTQTNETTTTNNVVSNPPTCSDSKPGSAPSGLSAVGGLNSVTLTWNKANDPVSYYLVTYGLTSGSQEFGNPNVGNSSITSYSISNLSGNTTYFFKVRAGNGCAPGEFSNEVSVIPSGGVVEGPATGFSEGVLGIATKEAGIDDKQNKSIENNQSPKNISINLFLILKILIGILIFDLILLVFIILKRKRKNMVK